MSIITNKKDFESALEELSSWRDDHGAALSSDFQDTVQNVINEYDHLQRDIEEMVEELEAAQDRIEDLENP